MTRRQSCRAAGLTGVRHGVACHNESVQERTAVLVMPHLGGVGMISSCMGSVTFDRRGCVSPLAPGDMMLKVTTPLASPSKLAPSGTTRRYKARWPDQGHSTSECSNRTSRRRPPSLVAVKMGSCSNLPAVPSTLGVCTAHMYVCACQQVIAQGQL